MTTPLQLELWSLAYLLNALWQVPLIFATAWIMARFLRTTGPRIEHRLWVCALFIEVVLPGCHLRVFNLLQQTWTAIQWRLGHNISGGQVRIILGPTTSSNSSFLHLSPRFVAVIATAYAATLIYFAARTAWGLRKTRQLQLHSMPLTLTGEPAQTWARLQSSTHKQGSELRAKIATTPHIAGPITIGILRKYLLVPHEFVSSISPIDLNAVLAHEHAHMRRNDFAKNLLYTVTSLPIAWHPLLWLTRSRIAESREIVCDAMAAETIHGREIYARSLLRLASTLTMRKQPATLHAIGIFDANLFERRIMQLTRPSTQLRGLKRLAVITACILSSAVLCASALAWRIEPGQSETSKGRPKRVLVSSSNVHLVKKVDPTYPVDAKKERIQGSVVLHAYINEEGVPTDLKVVSGPQELQQSALDAVHQWRYQPYLLNGDPIAVETEITVTYALAG